MKPTEEKHPEARIKPTVRTFAMDNVMTPDRIGEKGDEIYNNLFRKKYEGVHDGKFLAIDVVNAKAYLGDYPEDALDNAEKDNSDTNLYLVKIGAEAAFHVGHIGDQYYGMDWTIRQST